MSTIQTRRCTVGIQRRHFVNCVWVAHGHQDLWPGLLFGGITRRSVPKRYSERALRLVGDIVTRLDAGETDAPILPRGYFALRRILAAMEDE